jgi:hypothetical protein
MQQSKRRKREEDCAAASMAKPRSDPAGGANQLAAFIQAYTDDAPACLLSLEVSNSSDSSDKHTATITASNAAFTEEHKQQLLLHPSALLSKKALLAPGMRWSITIVPPSTSSDSSHQDNQHTTIVCIGRRQAAIDQQNDSFPSSGTSQNARVRAEHAIDNQPQHYSSGSSSAEDWLQRWSRMELPGTDRQAFLAHIDLIRKVDWSKTPLGAMDTWSTVLLSSLGQCLASPFPVLLAWGPELTQIYNLPYSYNIARKHPGNMGKSYKDAWPEVWERKLDILSLLARAD